MPSKKAMKAMKAMNEAMQAIKAAQTAMQEMDDEGAEGDEGGAEGDEEPAMQEDNEAVVVNWDENDQQRSYVVFGAHGGWAHETLYAPGDDEPEGQWFGIFGWQGWAWWPKK